MDFYGVLGSLTGVLSTIHLFVFFNSCSQSAKHKPKNTVGNFEMQEQKPKTHKNELKTEIGVGEWGAEKLTKKKKRTALFQSFM